MSKPSVRQPVMVPLSREDAERRAAQLGVVADPTRLRLMSLVLTHPAGEASVGQLAAEFDQSHTTISHHLRLLAMRIC